MQVTCSLVRSGLHISQDNCLYIEHMTHNLGHIMGAREAQSMNLLTQNQRKCVTGTGCMNITPIHNVALLTEAENLVAQSM